DLTLPNFCRKISYGLIDILTN
ncbi:uncharacterized protein METZ01_LOCUS317483, partial [marine metagenome]